MKNKSLQIFIGISFFVCLILLTDPFMVYMPPTAFMPVLLGAVIFLCIWSGLIMTEKAEDEREIMNRMLAGRTAYLLGLGVLTLAS